MHPVCLCLCSCAHCRCTLTCQHTCVHVFKLVYLLEFGPDIFVSSSWICLTSSEMCCSRSLFCSSSWCTRAWASSRAVASALSWSFNKWTCAGGGESRDYKMDRYRRGKQGGIPTEAQCSVYKQFLQVTAQEISTAFPYLNFPNTQKHHTLLHFKRRTKRC